MNPDSFENFDRYKILVNKELDEFISSFENAPERTKKLLHYQSVINVSNEIIRFNNSEAHILKDKLLEYFKLVEEIDFSIDENNYAEIQKQKMESRNRFNTHIYPIGSYLMSESEFRPKLPIGFYVFIGILADIIIYNSLTTEIVPLASILIIVIGILSMKSRKNKDKSFALFK